MARTLKVSLEGKTFLVRFEGESGGKWCSLIEHCRGSFFALGFEKEEVGWLIEHLTKTIELKSSMGFNRKYRGKSRVHLMEVSFNNHGRFIRLSKFASNRKSTFLVILEGEKGRGWEQIKNVMSSMLVVPSSSIVEKGWQCRGERTFHKHEGHLYWSFANVVREEGPRRGGLVLIGRWARAVGENFNEGTVSSPSFDRVAVVGVEDDRRDREMGESTREEYEPHLWTGGRRRVEDARSTAKGRSPVGAVGRLKERGVSQKVEAIFMGILGKRRPKVGEGWAGGDKAHSSVEEGHRASKQVRRAQSPFKPSPLGSSRREDFSAKGKGKLGSEVSEAQMRGSALKFGSKKLFHFKAYILSKGKEKLRKFSKDEDRVGSKGFEGFVHRGSSVTVFPSNPVTRGKGLNSVGTCEMMVVENFEVFSSPHFFSTLSSFPPSSGLALPPLCPSVPVLPNSVIQCILGERIDFPQIIETCWFWFGGLGSERVVKDFLRFENPDVVMFQETKREVCDRRFVGSVWPVRNKEWAAFLACGASEGILIIWDSKKLKFIKFLENERGLVLDNSESITVEILLYFEKLYSSPLGDASRLDSPFAEEEIFKAIFQLDRDKAPRPDGFTIAVFQDC
ncbi:hypothetical protein AAG906_022432 [Vitis piasezkii]